MKQLYIDMGFQTGKRSGEKCPFLDEGICRISGMKPENVGYSDDDLCRSNEWKKCSVYTLQFYYNPDESY